jgi:hypothetical protein
MDAGLSKPGQRWNFSAWCDVCGQVFEEPCKLLEIERNGGVLWIRICGFSSSNKPIPAKTDRVCYAGILVGLL